MIFRFRFLLTAASLALAALPVARAADESQPPPPAPPPPAGEWNHEGRPRKGPGDPREQLERMKTALSLTAEQAAQVEAIFKENAPKREALRDDTSLSQEDRFAKMMALRKESETKVRALLTPEQQQKFDAMPRPGPGRRGWGDHGGGRGPHGPPPPPPPNESADAPPPPPPSAGGGV